MSGGLSRTKSAFPQWLGRSNVNSLFLKDQTSADAGRTNQPTSGSFVANPPLKTGNPLSPNPLPQNCYLLPAIAMPSPGDYNLCSNKNMRMFL